MDQTNFEKLGTRFIKFPESQVDDTTIKESKVVALYFGASWATPCQRFVPKLVEVYKEINEIEENALEIIYINMDNNEKSFKESLREMPWISYNFKD